jgi:hypothetical protein
VGAGVDRLQRQRVVEMDVGDHRDRRVAHDRPQGLNVLVARDGDADQIRPGVGDLADLLHGRLEVGGLGLGHGLHGDRGAAPDGHAADEYLALRGHLAVKDRGGSWCRRAIRMRFYLDRATALGSG